MAKNFHKIILLLSISYCQSIPAQFHIYRNEISKISRGINWENHTLFGPIRLQSVNKKDSLGTPDYNLLGFQGILRNGNVINKSMYFNGIVKNYHNFYGYLFFRIVDDINMYHDFSGVRQERSRAGFEAGETDNAGIGYQNDWLMVQIGRGRHSWSYDNDINIFLNNLSKPYDSFSFGVNTSSVRIKYFTGFLENINEVNRYIVGKGIELTNKKNFLMNLSEVVIYSGLNRPFDFSYLNPVASHLEIEKNNKQNMPGGKYGNAIWQLSIDWMYKKLFRISGNFIIDELILDKEEIIEKGKDNGLGLSYKFSYLPGKIDDLLVYFSYISVGTHTYRHELGTNNFINKNSPLGWIHGSDGFEYNFGVRYNNLKNVDFELVLGNRILGENNILEYSYSRYDSYQKTSFPSGILAKNSFIRFNYFYYFDKIGYFLSLENNYLDSSFEQAVVVGFDYRISY
tara:strand:+ start:7721 stop:9088 length:1368 start_codon:yes stop_codon:yes gene_type:complete